MIKEINKLEKKIKDEHIATLNQCDPDVIVKQTDEIDEKLCLFVRLNISPIKFKRIDEGIYSFGTKRLTIKLING